MPLPRDPSGLLAPRLSAWTVPGDTLSAGVAAGLPAELKIVAASDMVGDAPPEEYVPMPAVDVALPAPPPVPPGHERMEPKVVVPPVPPALAPAEAAAPAAPGETVTPLKPDVMRNFFIA